MVDERLQSSHANFHSPSNPTGDITGGLNTCLTQVEEQTVLSINSICLQTAFWYRFPLRGFSAPTVTHR